MKKKNIGIIGCGKQGLKIIKILAKRNYKIFIFDSDKKISEKIPKEYDVVIKKKFNDLLDEKSIEAFLILTPTSTHYDYLLNLIEHNKKIFCEKPFVNNLTEYKNLKKKIYLSNFRKKIQVGYVYRYAETYQLINKLIKKKELGDVLHCNLKIYGLGAHKIWKHQNKFSGGVIFEMLSHMIDLSGWLFGQCIQIKYVDKKIFKKKRIIEDKIVKIETPDYCLAQLKFKNNLTVSIESNFFSKTFYQSIDLTGNDGFIHSNINDKTIKLISDKTSVYKIDNSNMFEKQILSFLNNKERISYSNFKDNYQNQLLIKKIKEFE